MAQNIAKTISSVTSYFSTTAKPRTNLIQFADCLACQDPCTHEQLPEYLQKKISDEEMYNSFKPYTQHFILSSGKANLWPHSIEEEQDSIFQTAYNKLNNAKERVVLTAFEKEEDEGITGYLYPKGLYFPTLSKDDISILAEWIALNDDSKPPVEYKDVQDNLVLVCSHKKRDKRCGVSGPLLVKEFNKYHNQVLSVSHFGGHKFAGNIIIYHKDGRDIWVADWYGRVKTCHVEQIYKECVQDGNVIKELWRGRMNADKTDPGLSW
ncbi:hypothetical protein HDV01_006473 [Terramyces sp. JEL0728]|nr:hypothetical protein HDV01_006473 [Terramyces sp. JEL0728]